MLLELSLVRQTSVPLTSALHQLVIAVFRKERVFHSSEVELQHTSHGVQVTKVLS